ncbi:MAG: FAD-dependent oxidoreductase, partial [Gammaproteobacteria bacterium]|nr:FAD-dependent oxidoreductase [Gammaproteobacteria bacterium]
IGGTKGSHLIAERFTGAPDDALYAEAASDGRPFFIIPWNGLYLIGTTDERFDGNPGAASISRDEFDYLVAETKRLFPAADDLEASVRYTYAGVRPLPNKDGVKTGAITRRHLVKRHRDVRGLYSIVGGKLTTHRALAVDCLRRLRRVFPDLGPSPTAERPLPGAVPASERQALFDDLTRVVGTDEAQRLWQTYGGRSRELVASFDASGDLATKLAPDVAGFVGELVFALEREWAISLVDLLQRRTMLGLAADFGSRAAPHAAESLVRLGYWDETRAASELAAYREFALRFAVPSKRGAAISS